MSVEFKYNDDIRQWPETDVPEELEKAMFKTIMEFADLENRVLVRGLIVRAFAYGWFSTQATINTLQAQLAEREKELAAAVDALERERSNLEKQRLYWGRLCYTCNQNKKTAEAGRIGAVACPHPMSVREKELTELIKDLSTTAKAHNERIRYEELARIQIAIGKADRDAIKDYRECPNDYNRGFSDGIGAVVKALQPAEQTEGWSGG